MNTAYLSLDTLPIGATGRVTALSATGNERRRFLDLGVVCGTEISALHKSPSGDPIAYSIRGAVIALRHDDAKKITVISV